VAKVATSTLCHHFVVPRGRQSRVIVDALSMSGVAPQCRAPGPREGCLLTARDTSAESKDPRVLQRQSKQIAE
jgi:hypothetical protein